MRQEKFVRGVIYEIKGPARLRRKLIHVGKFSDNRDKSEADTFLVFRLLPKPRNKRILELERRGVPRQEIAKAFGLSEMSISRIVRGLSGDPETANEKRSETQKGKKKGNYI